MVKPYTFKTSWMRAPKTNVSAQVTVKNRNGELQFTAFGEPLFSLPVEHGEAFAHKVLWLSAGARNMQHPGLSGSWRNWNAGRVCNKLGVLSMPEYEGEVSVEGSWRRVLIGNEFVPGNVTKFAVNILKLI